MRLVGNAQGSWAHVNTPVLESALVSSNEDPHKGAKGRGWKSQGPEVEGPGSYSSPLIGRQTGNRKQSGKSGPEAAYCASFLGLVSASLESQSFPQTGFTLGTYGSVCHAWHSSGRKIYLPRRSFGFDSIGPLKSCNRRLRTRLSVTDPQEGMHGARLG